MRYDCQIGHVDVHLEYSGIFDAPNSDKRVSHTDRYSRISFDTQMQRTDDR